MSATTSEERSGLRQLSGSIRSGDLQSIFICVIEFPYIPVQRDCTYNNSTVIFNNYIKTANFRHFYFSLVYTYREM